MVSDLAFGGYMRFVIQFQVIATVVKISFETRNAFRFGSYDRSLENFCRHESSRIRSIFTKADHIVTQILKLIKRCGTVGGKIV